MDIGTGAKLTRDTPWLFLVFSWKKKINFLLYLPQYTAILQVMLLLAFLLFQACNDTQHFQKLFVTLLLSGMNSSNRKMC